MADIERELGWDDEISKESDFVLLPEGDYNFTVVGFERGRHEGSKNLPACNKAIMTLRVELPDGKTQNLKHNLFLHSKTEGLLSAFFTCVGLKKKGEPLRMNWNAVIGARGRCKITVHTWKNKNGEDMPSNDIKRFYAPDEAVQQTNPASNAPAYQQSTPAASAPSGIFTPGKF